MNLNGIFYRDAKSSASPASPSPTPTGVHSSQNPPAAPSPTLQYSPPSSSTSASSTPSPPPSASGGGLLEGLLDILNGLLGPSAPLGGILKRRGPHHRTSGSVVRSHRRRSSSSSSNRSFPLPQRPGSQPRGAIELVAPWPFVLRDEDLNEAKERREARRLKKRQQYTGISAGSPLVPNPDLALNVTAPSSPTPPVATSPSTPSPPSNLTFLTSSSPEPAFGFTGIFFSTFFGGHDPTWASPADQHVWFKDFALQVNA